MRIEGRAAGFKLALIVFLGFSAGPGLPAWAGSGFRLEKDPQGQVRPFKAVQVPLADFVREYARLTSTLITAPGDIDQEISGTVTLFLRKSMSLERLKEVFYRVVADNGFSVVDAPSGNGWIIERGRDARDAALPVFESADAPDSGRLVTVHQELRHANSETIARMMRSFMPANSRIIPVAESQLLITDTASNIRKLNRVIARMDTPEAAARQKSEDARSPDRPPRSCGERKIEKLIVENLEVRNAEIAKPSPVASAPTVKKGARK